MSTISRVTDGWRWNKFRGSASALKWNHRDVDAVQDIVETYCESRRVAIQAGGNLGIFPKALAALFEQVYTFEADAENFVSMTINAPESNIVRIQAAVGERAGFVAVGTVRRDGKPDSHEGIRHVVGAGRVPMMAIDRLGVKECDLLYLDVEGFEYFALAGAQETIAIGRPVIVVEVNQNCEYYGVHPEQVRERVQGYGYRMVKRIQSDEVFIPCE